VDKSRSMEEIFKIIEDQGKQIEQLSRFKESVEEQRAQDKEDAILNAVSDVSAMEARDRWSTENPEPLVIVNVNAPYKDQKTKRMMKPAFTGKKDCCPFCTDVKKQESLLDVTNMGRWACRGCGKHWYEEALGQPYSKALERSFKTGAVQDDPLRFFKDGKQVVPEDRINAMQKMIDELKAQVEKNGTHKEVTK